MVLCARFADDSQSVSSFRCICTEDRCNSSAPEGSGQDACFFERLQDCCKIDDDCLRRTTKPCEIDRCNTTTGECFLEFEENGEPCEDGTPCTEGDECWRGVCEPGPRKDCSDEFNCTSDLCVFDTGECLHVNNDDLCDDLLFCTGRETCDPLNPRADTEGCLPGRRVDCSSFDRPVCGTGFCNEDEDECDTRQNERLCPGTFGCGDDFCNARFQCEFVPDDDDCMTRHACLTPVCGPQGNCRFLENDTVCSDGFFCNGMEECTQQGCVDGPNPVCGDEGVCGKGRCDRGLDECVVDCVDDICRRIEPVRACTIDKCELDKNCSHTTNDTACSDDCACTTDRCDVELGCVFTPIPGMFA